MTKANFEPIKKRIPLDETPQERGSRLAKQEYERARKAKKHLQYILTN